jgi:dihydrofolate synthase / folylpolyglutamate synthase
MSPEASSKLNVAQAGAHPTAAYQAAIDFLYGRINYEKVGHASYSAANYRLDRMRRLLELLDNPQSRYRIVHVAGTKGKGTTSTVVAHLLTHCGMRTGLFTSPHLLLLEERIQCDGIPCSAEALIGLVERVRSAAERLEEEGGGRPTFFEMTTAMGMLHFAEVGCDVAVLEVGLGGRLDSTNVCEPDVAVITSISFDHQAQLGNTIASIAGEKAGIIKLRVPVVCSARDEEARGVILQRAELNEAPVYLIDRDFSVQWNCLPSSVESVSAKSSGRHLAEIKYHTSLSSSRIGDTTWQLPILGRHQADNVAAALTTIDVLLQTGRLPSQALTVFSSPVDLQAALSSLVLPARLQLMATNPVRIIDVAHNPASLAATVNSLNEHFPGHSLTLVFASSRDKEFTEMLRVLLPRCQRVVLTAYQNNPRALPLPELQAATHAICQEIFSPTCGQSHVPEILAAECPADAWELATQCANSQTVVCGTGSFFLAAELLPLFPDAV